MRVVTFFRDATEGFAVIGQHGRRFVAVADLTRWIQQRIDQVWTIELAADVGQFRADLPALFTDAMARGALGTFVVEEFRAGFCVASVC